MLDAGYAGGSIAALVEPVSVIDKTELGLASNRSGPLIGVDDFLLDPRFQEIDGSGFSVAVLDTGIDLDDPFFGPDTNGDGISDRIVFTHDFTGSQGVDDVSGHGSNVSSIVASSDSTYMGVAPGVDIISLKVIGDNGRGSFRMLESALQWVVANARKFNIAAINLSLGDGGNYTTRQSSYGIGDELSALAAMDVITVAAAGNDFFEFHSVPGVAYPAAHAKTIAVGAVYDSDIGGPIRYGGGAQAVSTGTDQITPFSQRHASFVDVFAPGAAITGAGAGSSLVTMHGTSQAAPHVAGAAVLAQQLAVKHWGRRMTFNEFRDLLQVTGTPIYDGDDEHDNVVNSNLDFKRLDLVSLGETIITTAQEPEIVVTAKSKHITSGTGVLNLGVTTEGTAISKTITVANHGFATLTLDGGSLALPDGFSLAADFGTTRLAPYQSTTFSIQLDATIVGRFSGSLSFSNNDLDEGSYQFTVLGSVLPIRVVTDVPAPDVDVVVFPIPDVNQRVARPGIARNVPGHVPTAHHRANRLRGLGGRSTLQNASDQINEELDRMLDGTQPVVIAVSGDTITVTPFDGSSSNSPSGGIATEV